MLSGSKLIFRLQRVVESVLLRVTYPFLFGYVSKEAIRQRSSQIEREVNENFGIGTCGNTKSYLPLIISVPTCILKIEISISSANHRISDRLFMDMDMNIYSALITTGNTAVFFDSIPNDTCLSGSFNRNQSDMVKPAGVHLKFLIECAKGFSRDIFFLELPAPFSLHRSILGYYQQTKVKFICLNLGEILLFDTIDQLINEIFGSKEKLTEILRHQEGILNPGPCEKVTQANLQRLGYPCFK